jgi:hypothetical protein
MHNLIALATTMVRCIAQIHLIGRNLVIGVASRKGKVYGWLGAAHNGRTSVITEEPDIGMDTRTRATVGSCEGVP